MSFETRLVPAVGWELELIGWLKQRGLYAEPWGQANLTEACRVRLRYCQNDRGEPTLVRWMPDIIAIQGSKLCFIDAKTGRKDTPYYSIEIKALEQAEQWVACFYHQYYFIWDGFKVLTPTKIREHGFIGPPPSQAGSGTPYMLVRRELASSAEDVFSKTILDDWP